MNNIHVHTFKNSFGATIGLFDEHGVKYQMTMNRSDTFMASASVLEIVGNATIWVSLATILVTFVKAKNSRSVKITTNDNVVIEAAGLDSKQLQKVLEHTKSIAMIDTEKNET